MKLLSVIITSRSNVLRCGKPGQIFLDLRQQDAGYHWVAVVEASQELLELVDRNIAGRYDR